MDQGILDVGIRQETELQESMPFPKTLRLTLGR